MQKIEDIATLETLYEAPSARSITKVATHLTPHYRRWISAARFCILSTVGPEGTDATPRGDDGPVVHIADDRTIWLPDWRGNNRLDALRNIVSDGRVSLMFMIAGNDTVIRVNGSALVTAEASVTKFFDKKSALPRSVVVISVAEVYFQCAKALMRSRLWTATDTPDVPSPGQFLRERDEAFNAEGYDAGYVEYARPLFW